MRGATGSSTVLGWADALTSTDELSRTTSTTH